jgi:hypothetical protein
LTLPIPNFKKDAPHIIYKIPLEYLKEFTDAPYEAMRDLLAIPAVVKDALFPNPRVLEDRMDKLRKDPVIEDNLYQWINSKTDSPKSFNIFNEHLPKALNNSPYFIHVDLALVEDATGVCMIHREPKSGRFLVDFVFALESAKCIDKQIPIGKLKYLAIFLKYNMGYNVSKVTYDGYQSAESIQGLNDNGIDAKVQSVDRTSAPYDTLRELIHSDQISFYDYNSGELKGLNRSLMRELKNLTKDNKSGKVDHISKGSKDLADALAGAVFTCSAEYFEYKGVNDFTLETQESSETMDPYIFDGYSELETVDLKEFQLNALAGNTGESEEEKDTYQDDHRFYGDEF